MIQSRNTGTAMKFYSICSQTYIDETSVKSIPNLINTKLAKDNICKCSRLADTLYPKEKKMKPEVTQVYTFQIKLLRFILRGYRYISLTNLTTGKCHRFKISY